MPMENSCNRFDPLRFHGPLPVERHEVVGEPQKAVVSLLRRWLQVAAGGYWRILLPLNGERVQ